MATTLGQALAGQFRAQIEQGEQVIEAARKDGEDRSDAVFGSPQEVLTVRGNVSDIAVTSHLWLLDVEAAGLITDDFPVPLKRPRPKSIEETMAFLDPRDTDTAEQAVARLREVNECIAGQLERRSDEDLARTLDMAFYGEKTLCEWAFTLLHHGSLHLGQAWGILKGSGLA